MEKVISESNVIICKYIYYTVYIYAHVIVLEMKKYTRSSEQKCMPSNLESVVAYLCNTGVTLTTGVWCWDGAIFQKSLSQFIDLGIFDC